MSKNTERALNYWNNCDIIHEFANAQVPQYWKEFFLEILLPQECSVLDLGCGGGRNTQMLVSMGFNVRACDLHQGMVDATRQRIKPFTDGQDAEMIVRQGSMLRLPYEDNYFNIVLSNGIYHNASNVEEFETAIKETGRVLKEDGQLCLNVFTEEYVEANLQKQQKPFLYITPDNLDMVLLPIDNILEILERYSFRPEGELVQYRSKVATGERSVLRGVFRKNKSTRSI
ncbi:class I SAM-dependent methyltransferase [Ruminiclostridium cellulolyticum]|uniref:Methyltransferase type 11 n=1 Tax=Ruminiclostridium cellulolyticum (strain ATCC 35319 / DSM 5812 / JCM 6584 / H10) TaxID=394503 RepID=B8I9E6_RUMCH|nr:class I SAM-dependent methyltransferase [Ruminiclostridium cellulolyticum]ACL75406.1 Methyltransferase type 11 [Ruminiclostridium cellulolyticum H10]